MPAVTHLRMSPQLFHHQIRMLDRGANSRQTPVARALPFGQRTAAAAALIDVEGNASRLGLLLERLGMVGRVRVQTFLFPMQQLAQAR